MYEAHGLPRNPFKPKRLPRPPADDVAVTQPFTKAEATALLMKVDEEMLGVAKGATSIIGMRDRAIVRLLYDTGMRVSTVCSMRRDALREVEGRLFLITTVKKRGRVEVALPMTSSAVLEAWLEIAPPSPWVFPAKKKHVTRGAVLERLIEYGRRAGVKDPSPHRFRAAYITEALDSGLALHEVQAAVHHADPKTTQRYDRGVRGTGVSQALAKFREEKK
jgi:integrase/recombinase XerD